ncbi:hypothetical protein Ga0061065_105228 [Marinomonas fungiae]|uniref:Uncharacterized protein n=1 Tax=Marinomonas fungiae TaxID=1137284 RepID=A0A0K6ILE7_9GAMM|nr:hypothetical protein Ga0061065_105228 [Marinomonas fungiae]
MKMVISIDSFIDHAKVVNGSSDLLVEVLGERELSPPVLLWALVHCLLA